MTLVYNKGRVKQCTKYILPSMKLKKYQIFIIKSSCYNKSMKIKLFEEAKINIKPTHIEKVASFFANSADKKFSNIKKGTVHLISQNTKDITRLNKQLFSRNCPTDVISINSYGEKLIGELYICPKQINDNASEYNTEYKKEFIRVLIHGILHLAGFDHKKGYEKSDEEMFRKQEYILKQIFDAKET